MKGAGWVYVLTNPAMPGLVKIGLTTRNPAARAAELAGTTGVPAAFVVAWCRAVSDCGTIETTVHRMLADRRLSGRREFFRCDVATARQVIEAASGAKLGRLYRPQPRRAPGRWRRRRSKGEGAALLLLAVICAALILTAVRPGWMQMAVAHAVRALHD